MKPYLVLALGNDLLGDDRVGLAVARDLKQSVDRDLVDIVETGEAGLALMEILTGYEKVLILDSVQTCAHPLGTTIEFNPDDFRRVIAPSPHYAGLPEILAAAERFQLPMPSEMRILAMEVANPFDFSESFTPDVAAGYPVYLGKAREIVESWAVAATAS
jgi:hydrogenase maturation protease